jgi:hypothetical protein
LQRGHGKDGIPSTLDTQSSPNSVLPFPEGDMSRRLPPDYGAATTTYLGGCGALRTCMRSAANSRAVYKE